MLAERLDMPAMMRAFPLLRLALDVLIIVLLVVLLRRHRNAGFALMLVSTVLNALVTGSAFLGVSRFVTDAESAMVLFTVRTAVYLVSRGIFAVGLILLLRHRWRTRPAAVAADPAAPPMPKDA
jgi:hypothetical protein